LITSTRMYTALRVASHVDYRLVHLSLSICNTDLSCPYRLRYLESIYADNYLSIFASLSPDVTEPVLGEYPTMHHPWRNSVTKKLSCKHRQPSLERPVCYVHSALLLYRFYARQQELL